MKGGLRRPEVAANPRSFRPLKAGPASQNPSIRLRVHNAIGQRDDVLQEGQTVLPQRRVSAITITPVSRAKNRSMTSTRGRDALRNSSTVLWGVTRERASCQAQ